MPRRLLETSAGMSRACAACSIPPCHRRPSPARTWIRDEHGEIRVLEDNLRMPSGAAYSLALREVVAPELGAGSSRAASAVRPGARRGAARRRSRPRRGAATALVSDGPESGAWYEHQRLGRELGMPVVDASRAGIARADLPLAPRAAPIDVIYRRLDGDA